MRVTIFIFEGLNDRYYICCEGKFVYEGSIGKSIYLKGFLMMQDQFNEDFINRVEKVAGKGVQEGIREIQFSRRGTALWNIPRNRSLSRIENVAWCILN